MGTYKGKKFNDYPQSERELGSFIELVIKSNNIDRYKINMELPVCIKEAFPDIEPLEFVMEIENRIKSATDYYIRSAENYRINKRFEWEFGRYYSPSCRDTSTGEEWEVDSDGNEHYP